VTPPAITSPVPAPVWESVLARDPGAVVSQSLAWRDAVLADGRYRDTSMLFEFPGGRRIVLPMARPRRRPPWASGTGSWPGGWGVGGPIAEGGQVTQAEAEAVLARVARLPAVTVQIQLRHDPCAAWLSAASAFEAGRRGCHVLDLEGGFGQVWQRRFRGTARTAVRKAERSGIEVDVDHSGRLLPVFYDLYRKSQERWAARQHEPVWLARLRTARSTSQRAMSLVCDRFGKDCAIWVARSQGIPVAGIIVLTSQGCAKYWRGAMDAGLAGRTRATDLLHRLAIEAACDGGYRWYDMGWTRPGSPLAAFKEKFGATLHYTYLLRAERLPLHRAGDMSRDVAKKLLGFTDA
jgi:Acetyltransferase (GNAT) domain